MYWRPKPWAVIGQNHPCEKMELRKRQRPSYKAAPFPQSKKKKNSSGSTYQVYTLHSALYEMPRDSKEEINVSASLGT